MDKQTQLLHTQTNERAKLEERQDELRVESRENTVDTLPRFKS